MIKKAFYVMYFMLIAMLLLIGCGGEEKAKTELKEMPQEEAVEAGKEEDFSALLDKLKQGNPFSKDHSEIYKYKFSGGVFSLSGIFYDGEKPAAIINERVVNEGDMIGDKQVIRIMQDEVILRDKEKEYRLKTE